MEPITATLLAAGAQAIGSIGGGYLAGRNAGKETPIDKRRKKLLDKLMASLEGSGPYADLYNFDENVFNKSFVEPAKAMFNNQIAPQIQQQYIASGQQRGTGLDDTLTRAGVDLNALLNQHMFEAQENAKNRKMSGINSALGVQSGQPDPNSGGQDLMQAGAGYLSSQSFSDSVADLKKQFEASGSNNSKPSGPPARPGYKADWRSSQGDWQLGDKRWN